MINALLVNPEKNIFLEIEKGSATTALAMNGLILLTKPFPCFRIKILTL